MQSLKETLLLDELFFAPTFPCAMFKPIFSSPTFEQQSIVRNVEMTASGAAMVMEHSVEQKTLAGAGEPWSNAFQSIMDQKTLAGAGEPWSSLEVSVEQKTLAGAWEPWSVMEQSVEQKTLAGAGEPRSTLELSVEQKTLAGAGEPWSSDAKKV